MSGEGRYWRGLGAFFFGNGKGRGMERRSRPSERLGIFPLVGVTTSPLSLMVLCFVTVVVVARRTTETSTDVKPPDVTAENGVIQCAAYFSLANM